MNRDDGGQMGYLHERAQVKAYGRDTPLSEDQCVRLGFDTEEATTRVTEQTSLSPLGRQSELRRMHYTPGLTVKSGVVRQNRVTEERFYYEEERALSQMLMGCALDDEERPLRAKIATILEPLKVRTVSKGEELPYFFGKELQKVLHTALRREKCFELIGKPFEASQLIELRHASRKFIKDPDQELRWQSVDYSAATDRLSARISRLILARLLTRALKHESEDYEDYAEQVRLLTRVLAPHWIEYPKVVVDSKEPQRLPRSRHCRTIKMTFQLDSVLQQNGQLMGSILSFPILCLANLAVYLNVRRRTYPDVPLRRLINAVRINGDDMLYIGRDTDFELHKQCGDEVGLEMSPGKAYFHHSYANVNSASVEYDLTRPNSVPRFVGFLNVGLMLGKHKVMKKESVNQSEWDDPLTGAPTCSSLVTVLAGARPVTRCRVAAKFISLNRKVIAQECRGRNLFLPASAGGMGIDPPPGFKFKITDQQKALARLIGESSLWSVPNERPLRHPEIATSRPPGGGPFHVTPELAPEPFTEADSVRKVSNRELRKAMALGWTYVRPVTPAGLASEHTESWSA
jgi:hypothetical protein